MGITRRVFLKSGAMTVVGMAVVPEFLTRAAMAANAAQSHKRLVVIFQRGAADGLNIVVPHGEAAYYAMRPTIAIPQRDVIDLDGFFGLHPGMSALKPLWDAKHLAIVHAAGSPDATRSQSSPASPPLRSAAENGRRRGRSSAAMQPSTPPTGQQTAPGR